jgi:hypothetical protein
MSAVTQLEAKLLRNIAENEYTAHNGRRPAGPEDFRTGDGVWSNCLNAPHGPERIEPKSIPGILSSLIKKELAKSDNEYVWLTREGFAAYLQSRS